MLDNLHFTLMLKYDIKYVDYDAGYNTGSTVFANVSQIIHDSYYICKELLISNYHIQISKIFLYILRWTILLKYDSS